MELFRRTLLTTLLVACSLGSTGCVSSILANRIIRAPNRHTPPARLKPMVEFQQLLDREYYSFSTTVHVEPFPADLSVAVIEPGDYKLRHEVKLRHEREDDESSRVTGINFHFSLSLRDKNSPPLPPKGTIVVLHGVM